MKKIISFILIAIFSMSLMACGSRKTNSQTDADENDTVASSQKETINTEPDESNADKMETDEKVLVVYFSNTGNTRNIAELIADGIDADIYEIEAAEPYTEDDLDWNDSNSRSTKEMNDKSARPEISGSIDSFEQYTTVYIGYPIWWGEAPRIMDTFVETYDLSNKTIVPFCTSASSGVGSSASNLESVAGAGTWLNGKRFSGSEESGEVMDWVNDLDIQ